MRLLVPGRDEPGLYVAGGPERLAGLHPAWARDLERFGPLAGPAPGSLFALGERPLYTTAPGQGPDEGSGDGPSVVAVAETSSTMDLFWALSGQETLPAFTGVASALQTAARGQLRRAWSSPAGNLHVTFSLPAPEGSSAKAWDRLLPLVLGELAASALEELPGVAGPVRLKWPNDLVVGGRKVAGLLLEERAGRLAVGLGVNLAWAPPPDELRDGYTLEAGLLAGKGLAPGPLALWSALEKKLLFGYVVGLKQGDPTSFVSRVQGRLLWLGRPIMYTDGNKEVLLATLAGLSPDGGLRLKSWDGTEKTVYTGQLGPADGRRVA